MRWFAHNSTMASTANRLRLHAQHVGRRQQAIRDHDLRDVHERGERQPTRMQRDRRPRPQPLLRQALAIVGEDEGRAQQARERAEDHDQVQPVQAHREQRHPRRRQREARRRPRRDVRSASHRRVAMSRPATSRRADRTRRSRPRSRTPSPRAAAGSGTAPTPRRKTGPNVPRSVSQATTGIAIANNNTSRRMGVAPFTDARDAIRQRVSAASNTRLHIHEPSHRRADELAPAH